MLAPTLISAHCGWENQNTLLAETSPKIPNADRDDTTTRAHVLRKGRILLRGSRVGARGAWSECWECPEPKSRGVYFWGTRFRANPTRWASRECCGRDFENTKQPMPDDEGRARFFRRAFCVRAGSLLPVRAVVGPSGGRRLG